jgi:hypothetical protein
MSIRKPASQRTLAEQASRELLKLGRMIRLVDRRGDRAVCERLLSHARRVQEFVEKRQYSQALHVARCRMKG